MPTQALPPRRPLQPEEREDSTDDLQNALGSVLGVAANVFIDRPGFVASNDEVDPLSAAVRGLTRLNCRRWAAADKSGFSPRVNNYNASVCDPYLESIGENPDGGDIGPEFLGGQCPIDYFVNGTQTNYAVDGSVDSSGPFQIAARGPVGGLSFSNSGGGPTIGPLAPGATAFYFFLNDANGRQLAGGNGNGGVRAAITSIVPQGPQPDTCGNPPTTYQPPNKVTPDTPVPPGITINLPGIGDITVNVDLDPTGDPRFTLPDIGVDFGIELGGGDGDEDGGGGGEGVPPGYQGEPGSPVDVGPGEAADETDPNRNLIGVLVQTIETPPRANQVFNFTETYTKGSYFVYFGGDGGLSLNPEGAIARQDQFYYAPEGANRFRVVPNNGFTIRVTPFYEDSE